MMPVDESCRPSGSVPLVTLHRTSLTLALRVSLYGVPTVPSERPDVIIAKLPVLFSPPELEDSITMLNCFDAEAEPSVALTVKVNVPALDGVPEIIPDDALRLNPSGRFPEATDHVSPDVPVVVAVSSAR